MSPFLIQTIMTIMAAYTACCLKRELHYQATGENQTFSGRGFLNKSRTRSVFQCAIRCQELPDCQQFQYNRLSRECDLYPWYDNSKGHSPGPEWQSYRAIPAAAVDDGYRTSELIMHVHSRRNRVCDAGQHTVSCPLSRKLSQWALRELRIFSTGCISKMTTYPNEPENSHGNILVVIPHPAVGSVICMRVEGYLNRRKHHIDLWTTNGDFPYRLRLRWDLKQPKAVFYTERHGGPEEYDRERAISPINDLSNYTIDIHIMENKFKTVVDGQILLTNDMTMPFYNVNKLISWNLKTILYFKIGTDPCPDEN